MLEPSCCKSFFASCAIARRQTVPLPLEEAKLAIGALWDANSALIQIAAHVGKSPSPTAQREVHNVSYEIVTRRIGELIEELDLCVVGALVIANLRGIEFLEDFLRLFGKPKLGESAIADRADQAVLGIGRIVAGIHVQVGTDDRHRLHI